VNPVLIGQAEEIDLVQPQVRAMLKRSGFYIGGDTKHPDVLVPLVVMDGKVYSMVVDQELHPERFFETLTLQGPFPADADEMQIEEERKA
jgi:hypothetical protein